MAYNMGGRRFRPVGSGKKRTAPQYGPVGTGCPCVEEAVARRSWGQVFTQLLRMAVFAA